MPPNSGVGHEKLMHTLLLISLAISLALGLPVGVGAMYLAWQHNPQCELHCAEQGIQYGALFGVGTSWVMMVSVSSFIVGGVLPASIRGLIGLASKGRCAQQASRDAPKDFRHSAGLNEHQKSQ